MVVQYFALGFIVAGILEPQGLQWSQSGGTHAVRFAVNRVRSSLLWRGFGGCVVYAGALGLGGRRAVLRIVWFCLA